MDVLDTVLLSLHPKSKLKDLSLSDYTREGLAEIQQFQDLIHMDIHKGYDGHGRRSVTLIPSKAPKLPKQLHMYFAGLRGLMEATTRTCQCG